MAYRFLASDSLTSRGRRSRSTRPRGPPPSAKPSRTTVTSTARLPVALTQNYPPSAPVPVPVTSPTPVGGVTYGTGPYANPDNIYEHIAYTTTRGNLVVTAKAPTYQTDSNSKANDLARTADHHPQVRYWSLCTTLKGRHTGDCLRDEQISIPPGRDVFTLIVSPTCPVVGYANCLLAGPEPLQSSLAYRNLLPSANFKPIAFTGAYRMTATYVARNS